MWKKSFARQKGRERELHRLHLPQAANPAVDPKALFHQTKGNGGALARVRLRTCPQSKEGRKCGREREQGPKASSTVMGGRGGLGPGQLALTYPQRKEGRKEEGARFRGALLALYALEKKIDREARSLVPESRCSGKPAAGEEYLHPLCESCQELVAPCLQFMGAGNRKLVCEVGVKLRVVSIRAGCKDAAMHDYQKWVGPCCCHNHVARCKKAFTIRIFIGLVEHAGLEVVFRDFSFLRDLSFLQQSGLMMDLPGRHILKPRRRRYRRISPRRCRPPALPRTLP